MPCALTRPRSRGTGGADQQQIAVGRRLPGKRAQRSEARTRNRLFIRGAQSETAEQPITITSTSTKLQPGRFAHVLSRGNHCEQPAERALQSELPRWRLHVIMQHAQ